MKAPPTAGQLQLVHTQEDELHNSPALYVFEPQQGGYIIASADERAYPILGYNETGTFRKDSIPCCLKFILENYSRQIAEARKQNISPYKAPVGNDTRHNIEPLLTSEWGQGAPYNNLCPIDPSTGKRSVTGCVATAMAQIMYYHKWPNQGIGSYTFNYYNTPLYANFEETTYRWDLMYDKYLSGDNDAEDAVATLMYHCGMSLPTIYGSSQSAGGMHKQLSRHFRYSDIITHTLPNKHGDDCYNELLHNRPFMVGAGNHAFICDGYRQDDYFHYNLGWNGGSNGFYKMSAVAYQYDVSSIGTNIVFRIIPETNVEKFTDNLGNIYCVLDDKAFLLKFGEIGEKLTIPERVTSPSGVTYPIREIDLETALGNGAKPQTIYFPKTLQIIRGYKIYLYETEIHLSNNIPTVDEGLSCKSVFVPFGLIDEFKAADYWKKMDNLFSEPLEVNGVSYSDIGGNKVIVWDGSSATGNVVIPERITVEGKDYAVTEIAARAFYKNNDITSIAIPSSVTSIGDYAFNSCSGLLSVSIPNSVTSIGKYAFAWNYALDFTIPPSVTFLDEGAFAGCYQIYMSNTIPTISQRTFTNVLCVWTPWDMIDEFKAADGWKDLDNLYAGPPVEINGIGYGGRGNNEATLVYGYDATGNVVIPERITVEGKDYAVTEIGNWAFSENNTITYVVIPNTVTSIGKAAFYHCDNLKHLTLPASVTQMGWGAIYGRSYETLTSYLTEPFETEFAKWTRYTNNVATGTFVPGTLYVPYGTKAKYEALEDWKYFENIVEMSPTGIKDLDNDNDNVIITRYYTIDGKQLNGKPVKAGMYIVRMNDGTMKKIMVK